MMSPSSPNSPSNEEDVRNIKNKNQQEEEDAEEDMDMNDGHEIDCQEEDSDIEDDGYESDDPEQWGPYYWSEKTAQEGSQPMVSKKAWDYMKYGSFKTYRALNFAGEVMVHFFGLNDAGMEWSIDDMKAFQDEERRELEDTRVE